MEKEATQLWTKDVPASWFCLDLGPTRSVLLMKYTLRHGMKFKSDSLRTWDLQVNSYDSSLLISCSGF